MRLVRFAVEESARIGVLQEEGVRDLTDTYPNLSDLVAAAHGEGGGLAKRIAAAALLKKGGVRLLPPIDLHTHILCVAANYHAHAAEAGLKVPDAPVLFSKYVPSMVGPDEEIVCGPISRRLDYEVELTVVIGRYGRNIPREDALGHVGGYTILNDVTARDIQWTMLGANKIPDWFSSKCLERSSPVGPWIVTADEIPDPQKLRIRSWVNGELRQDESTAFMVHDVAALIAFASSRMPLRPADLIATGTPKGVGGFEGRFLADGDLVEGEVERVGRLANRVRFVDR